MAFISSMFALDFFFQNGKKNFFFFIEATPGKVHALLISGIDIRFSYMLCLCIYAMFYHLLHPWPQASFFVWCFVLACFCFAAKPDLAQG